MGQKTIFKNQYQGLIIPPVDINDPYVYLDTLIGTNSSYWTDATEQINTFINNNDVSKNEEALNRLQNARKYLFDIAASERRKEMLLLEKKYESLKKQNNNNPQLEKLCELIEQYKNDPSHGIDYIQYTRLLNKVLQDNNNFSSRLKALTNTNGDNQIALLEDAEAELQQMYKKLTSSKKRLQKYQTTYSKLVNDFLKSYIDNNKTQLITLFQGDDTLFPAWISKLQINFRAYLEQESTLKSINDDNENFNIYQKNLSNTFNSFMSQYMQTKNGQLTLDDKERKSLEILAKNMNIKIVEDITALNPKQRQELKDLIELPILNTSNNPNKHMYIKVSTTKYYSIAERLNIILPTQIQHFIQSGGSNMGDDAIGAITFFPENTDTEVQKEIDAIDEKLKTIDTLISAFAKQRSDRKKFITNFNEFNTNLLNTLKQLDEEINDPIFIFHESDKFYLGAEANYAGSSAFQGFSGRTIAFNNFIDMVQNLDKFPNVVENANLYRFVVINLGENSPGANTNAKSIMENIFSHVAALLMFDDAVLTVQESVKEISFTNITNIHLYRLQSIFVPASYILEQTASHLADINNTSFDNAVNVNIHVGTNKFAPGYKWIYKGKSQPKALQFFENDKDQRWSIMRDTVLSSTLVSMHFFLKFGDFISQINNP